MKIENRICANGQFFGIFYSWLIQNVRHATSPLVSPSRTKKMFFREAFKKNTVCDHFHVEKNSSPQCGICPIKEAGARNVRCADRCSNDENLSEPLITLQDNLDNFL
jgi:hypothetical protein